MSGCQIPLVVWECCHDAWYRLLCDKELNHSGVDGRLMDKWICGATHIVSGSYSGDPAPRIGSFMQESVCFWKLKG